MRNPIKLYENLRTVVYVPFYMAIERGDWATMGINVEVELSPTTSETAQGIIDGRVDVAWGGPMRVMLHHDQDRDCPLVCFGQVVARDPSIIVGREVNDQFHFANLVGKRVGIISEVPTPWMTLQDDLGRAGVDLESVDWIKNQTMTENAEALVRGTLDAVQIFEPYAGDLVQRGAGKIWHRCAVRGDSCWTSFYTTRAFIQTKPSDCQALVRGIERALGALHSEDPANIALAVGKYFPELQIEDLARMIEGYRNSRLWPLTTELPVTAFTRLKAAMLSGGLISFDAPYDHLVIDVVG